MAAADEPVTTSAERVARNGATFRQANEEIRGYAAKWEMGGPLPAICECADMTCTAIVSLTPAEYEDVRAHSARFIHVPGHEASDHGWARVIADFGEYVVVEKIGEAAEIAKQLNPRAGG
jgi:hypothetical protein